MYDIISLRVAKQVFNQFLKVIFHEKKISDFVDYRFDDISLEFMHFYRK